MNSMHTCFSFSSRASFLRTPTVLAKVILNLNHARHQQIPAVKLLPTEAELELVILLGLVMTMHMSCTKDPCTYVTLFLSSYRAERSL